MTSANTARILEAHLGRPIDGETVKRVFAEMRSNPDELTELLGTLIARCDAVANASWLFPPVCGWLPLERLDKVAELARRHLTDHEGCAAATTLLAHHGLRRPVDEPAKALHFAFPPAFLEAHVDRWGFRVGQPSWTVLSDARGEARVGGSEGTCPRCGGPAERLLWLPSAALAEITSARRDLVFIWCAWCSPFVSEATFSALDEMGTAAMLPLDLLVDPGPWQAIEGVPEVAVGLVDLGPEWYRQDWMWANGVENLYRVGGEPTWIQNPANPSCPRCGEQLRFVAQMDIADLTGGEGLAYLFWCEASAVSGVVFQQT